MKKEKNFLKHITNEQILKQFNDFLTKNKDHSGWKEWREKEVVEGFKFFYGDQWDDAKKTMLKQRGLTPIVFNRTSKFIKSAANSVGKAVGEPSFMPHQGAENDGFADVGNQLIRWGRNQADAQYHEKQMRIDAAICGLGCVEQVIDYSDNPYGEPRYYRVPPIELLWDTDASGVNFSDSREVARAKIYSKEQFKAEFVDDDSAEIDPDMVMNGTQKSDESDDANFTFGELTSDSRISNGSKMVFDYQWWEKEEVYLVENPLLEKYFQQLITAIPEIGMVVSAVLQTISAAKPDAPTWELTEAEKNALEKAIGEYPLTYNESKRKVYYKALLTQGKVYSATKGAFPNQFSYKFLVLFYDEDKRHPYGYMRALKDPQRVANASFVHMMEAVLTAPRPSIIAKKTGTTDDTAGFEKDIADRKAVIWVDDPSGIVPNNAGAIPSGFETPMDVSINAMPDVTGLNLEMLGQADTEVSGVLDMVRTERGFESNRDFIDAFRFYLKVSTQGLLHMVSEIARVNPAQMVKVVGEECAKYLPLLMDKSAADYRVEVQDAPQTITQKQENTKLLMEMLDKQLLPPDMQLDVVAAILENANMPKTLRDKFSQKLEAMLNPDPQSQAAAAEEKQRNDAMQARLIEAQATAFESEAIKDRADADYKKAQAVKIMTEANMNQIKTQLGAI